MGPDGMHPRVLKELTDVIARQLSSSKGHSNWGKFMLNGKSHITPIFKDKKEYTGNYRPVSLTSVSRKVMEQSFLEAICKYMKDKKATESSQQGFTKGKSCLTKLIAFYDEVTGTVDKGRQRMLYTLTEERPLTQSPIISLSPNCSDMSWISE